MKLVKYFQYKILKICQQPIEIIKGLLTCIKGILCDFAILTLKQIIFLNKYCTYNKPIPEISHVKTL